MQISTRTVQTLCEAGVSVCYFSMGGWFYGIMVGLNEKNVFLRRSQFRLSYRRLLEIESRLLARVVEGEIGEYPVFTTR